MSHSVFLEAEQKVIALKQNNFCFNRSTLEIQDSVPPINCNWFKFALQTSFSSITQSGVAKSGCNNSIGALGSNLTTPLGKQFEHLHCMIVLQLEPVHMLSRMRMLPELDR